MQTTNIPSQKEIKKFVLYLFDYLFPTNHRVRSELNISDLQCNLCHLLSALCEKPEQISQQFFDKLNDTKQLLNKDAQFILESDPAATQLVEVVAIYPGFFAIFCYRIANVLAQQNIPLLPRMITEYAHKVTGIDIHPLATIGCPFSIDHGTGIVIGETTHIGNEVKVYQGVTLGALSVDKSKATRKRHPTIEDNVILYAGCTILGGETVVGRNSIIGGNVWLTESIAPYTVVYHKSEIVVRNTSNYEEPINFII